MEDAQETTSRSVTTPPPANVLHAPPLDYARAKHNEPPYLPNVPANVAFVSSIIAIIAIAVLYFAGPGIGSSTGISLALIAIPVSSILATILGIMGLTSTRDGRTRGKAIAISAISIGAMGILSLASILLLSPSQSSRATAPRVRCSANLKQIGLAMQLYANENKGQYPPRLEDLLLTQDITPEVFVCPDTADTPAPGSTIQQQASNLMTGGHCSYIYLGKGITASAPANMVLAYEPPSNHNKTGFNILFADGHAEFMSGPQAQKILNELQSGQNPPPSYH